MARHSWRLGPLFLVALSVGCTRPNLAYGDGGTAGGSGGQTGEASLGPGDSGADGQSSGSGEGEGEAGETDTGTGPCEVDNGGCSSGAQCEPDGDEDVICSCPEGQYDDGRECAVPSLEIMRVNLPCIGQPMACGAPGLCEMASSSVSAMFLGDPEVLYQLTFEVLGVVEEADYFDGVDHGWYYEGGEPVAEFRNAYRLDSDELPEHLFLNLGGIAEAACVPLQETLVLELPGDSTLELSGENGDLCGVMNGDVSVADMMPMGDGQFMQLELISVD